MRFRPTSLLYNRLLSPRPPCLLTPQHRIFPRHFELANPLRVFSPHRSLHTALWAPLVFANILLALWAYKCMMLIIFQNKLIYLPYIPFGARQESIHEYRPQLLGLDWTTAEVRTRDGKKLVACVAEIRRPIRSSEVVLVYFQGNASSMPSRLPFLSRILSTLADRKRFGDTNISVVAPSYRGYWLSNGRPSQIGLEKDAMAVLEWLRNRSPDCDINVIFIGHSLGAGVACYAAANNPYPNVKIRGVLLETPFTSVPDMLRTLYPQKWLPYHYLTPFLRSSWNIQEYLEKVSVMDNKPRFMIVQAENDEIVAEWMAPEIQKAAKEKGLTVDFIQARGALHFECITTKEFPGWVTAFVQRCLDVDDTIGSSIS